MRFEAITWARLTDALADLLDGGPGDLTGAAAGPGPWIRVAVDGAPAARTAELAGRLADALRLRGRTVLVVGTEGFLRPASLRFEFGKQDPDTYYDGWFDIGALWREVFSPLEPGAGGRVLPDLWDPVSDRATRSGYVQLPPGGVVLVHGPMLLRHWFPFDLAVHVRLSPGALERRTGEAQQWTLPALARYEAEGATEAADVIVRADDPGHPAWTGVRA